MNQYIAVKHCNFAGRRYNTGEAIEPGAVDPNRAPTLEKYGIIRMADDGEAQQMNAKPSIATKAKRQNDRKKVE